MSLLDVTGWILIIVAAMMGAVVFFLPIFEGQRIAAFWFVILPIATAGALIFLCRLGK